MRKLYALLAGVCLFAISTPLQARHYSDDIADFTFTISSSNLNVVFTNTSVIGSEPGTRKAFWSFGDGMAQWTLPLAGTEHRYQTPGTYTVCLKIFRYNTNTGDSVLSAHVCRNIVVEALCLADFERVADSTNPNPLQATFHAIPWHHQGKKPVRICWRFGDGRDTCIQYSNTFTGPWPVNHVYAASGQYNVFVSILYDGGCEAWKSRQVQVAVTDSCRADFEKLNTSSTTNPLTIFYQALPSHNLGKKPARICWSFGDGTDTCINYLNIFNGAYTVSHTYSQAGNYEVCVNIHYYGGCEARKCRIIPVGHPDSCKAEFERIPLSNVNDSLMAGFHAIPWHNNNKKPARICWNFGDGQDTCIEYSPNYTGSYTVSHRYAQPGEYMVCVKIIYYGGCEASKCRLIQVPPRQCSVQVQEIMPTINSPVRSFYAALASQPPSTPVRICWRFGDGTDTCIVATASTAPDLTVHHTFPGPGDYHVCVRVVFANNCVAEDCEVVFVRPLHNMCGGFMSDSLTAPRTYRFRGFAIHDPSDQVLSYRWTFGDGSSALGRDITHVYGQPGDFEVCLYIKTVEGCETRICKMLHVPGLTQPALVLSPNPVTNTLHVQFLSTHTEPVTIRLVNSNGVVVRTVIFNAVTGANNWDLDVSNLMPGIYTLLIQSANQQASALFIKQ